MRSDRFGGRTVIAFSDVAYTYAGADRPALSGVTLSVEPGRVLAVCGPNGSGKSTLARLCDGLLVPTVGRVTVDGIKTTDRERIWDVRALVGMVFQDPDDQIVGTVVEEDAAFGPENLGIPPAEIRRRVSEALAAAGLAGLERREPHLLSEGQKQRVAIAGALALGSAYLVLDEPSALLDPAGRRAVLALVTRLAREEGRGIVHVAHGVEGVAAADRAVVLDGGEVVYCGEPAGLLSDASLVDRAGLVRGGMPDLVEALERAGAPVPAAALDAESVVAALWR